MKRVIILDTETTGFSRSAGDRIIELCALEVVNGHLTGRKFHSLFNPEREIPESATKVNGITKQMVQDRPIFADLIPAILEFFELSSGTQLVIHNAPFDRKFIEFEFSIAGVALELSAAQIIDTLPLARAKLKGGKHNLDELCNRLGVENRRVDTHGAEVDCLMLFEVYGKLIQL